MNSDRLFHTSSFSMSPYNHTSDRYYHRGSLKVINRFKYCRQFLHLPRIKLLRRFNSSCDIFHNGELKLKTGVAPERCISIEDEEMRHGRKSQSQRFDGYKCHVLRDLDNGLVRAVGVTRANIPEASVTDAIAIDLKCQQVNLVELHIGRAYLSSSLVQNRSDELTVYCKAWQVKNGLRFTKTAFTLDWDN